jgi:type IV pilus assembly protein PilC
MAIDTSRIRPSAQTETQKNRAQSRASGSRPSWGQRVSGKDLIYFTSQLSLMIEVGTSLTDAVSALEKQTENATLRHVLRELENDMESGQSLSAALARHPTVFDGVFVSMVRAGETGGYFNDALDRIVEMREKREALLAQVRAALAYPIILTVIAAFVIVFILTGVLPKFMPLFEGKEAILPGSTRFLMAASVAIGQYWWAMLPLLGGSVFAIMALLKTDMGSLFKDKVSISIPVIGPLTNKILTGQLLRTLGHLLESHVTLLDALKVTRMTLGNRFYRELIDKIEGVVQSGGRLSQAFRGFEYTPASVQQMLATGEESGNLYQVMLRLAQYYDQEIEQALKRAASLIEPLALIVLGGIVGVIVASVILPLFKLAHAIG